MMPFDIDWPWLFSFETSIGLVLVDQSFEDHVIDIGDTASYASRIPDGVTEIEDKRPILRKGMNI